MNVPIASHPLQSPHQAIDIHTYIHTPSSADPKKKKENRYSLSIPARSFHCISFRPRGGGGIRRVEAGPDPEADPEALRVEVEVQSEAAPDQVLGKI